MYYSLGDFYRSREWLEFRDYLINKRMRADGFVYDEITGKPIVNKYDIILHHKIELTLENVNDCNITLNESNIQIVSHKTHDEIHERYGTYTRHIYIVYGSAFAGKKTWVKSIARKHDLVIELDTIRQAITGGKPYERSNRVNDNVFSVRDLLIDMVRMRRGKWVNAYIIGGYAYSGERERLANDLGAELIYIDTNKEECLARLEASTELIDKKEYKKYIEDWFKLNSGY